MKKIAISLLLAASIIHLSAQDEEDIGWNEPYESGIQTLAFEVLDINWETQILAFRHVYQLRERYVFQPDEDVPLKPVHCKYAGMEKSPGAGVILGVYDLKNQVFMDVFVVYKSTYYHEECTDFEESKIILEEAKQVFESYNLDISKKPKKANFIKKDKVVSEITLAGFHFRTEYFYDMDEFMMISKLFASDTVVHQKRINTTFSFGAEGNIIWEGAYMSGKKVIFVYKMFRTNNMEGPSGYEYYEFTPIFDLDSIQ
jgi:hypothetical protein